MEDYGMLSREGLAFLGSTWLVVPDNNHHHRQAGPLMWLSLNFLIYKMGKLVPLTGVTAN